MKTLSEYKAEITLKLIEQEAKDMREEDARQTWVDSLDIEPHEDCDEDNLEFFRTEYIQGRTPSIGIKCDFCGTLVVRSSFRQEVQNLTCLGCGYIEADVPLMIPEKTPTLSHQVQELTKLVALLLSSPTPFVNERVNNFLSLKMPLESTPFHPFQFEEGSLVFCLEEDGENVTIQLRGQEKPLEEDAPTRFDQLEDEENEEPEVPVCQCGSPVVLGSNRCRACNNMEIFRNWLSV